MLRKCIFVAAMALTPILGHSMDLTNWYLKGLVGFNFLSIPSPSDMDTDANVGYAVGGGIGYQLPCNFRVEGELTYRHNTLDQLTIKGSDANLILKLDGSISSLAYIGNLLFDFPVAWACVPYVGFGLGGYQEWNKVRIPAFSGTENDLRLKSSISGVGYQFIAGFNWLTCNKITADVEYRFFDSASVSGSNNNHSLVLSCCKVF